MDDNMDQMELSLSKSDSEHTHFETLEESGISSTSGSLYNDSGQEKEKINFGFIVENEKEILVIKQNKFTTMEIMHAREKQRTTCFNVCRDLITRISEDKLLRRAQVETLLNDKEFCKRFFCLFDHNGDGSFTQEDWIVLIKENLCIRNSDVGTSSDKRTDIIELLEAIAYIVCGDHLIDHESLRRILSSKGIPGKILILADSNKDGVVSVEEMMDFIIIITTPRYRTELTPENLKHLENVFREHLADDKTEFTLAEFKKIVPSKNPFFVERAFRIFDQDGNGTVSMVEFINTMHQFAGPSSDEKLIFLFKVYDLDDDGLIQQSDLQEVMKACMEENGMKFDDKEIEDLAQALYEDAAGLADGESKEEGITIEDLKAELLKHDGLLENLSISIGKWLVPSKPSKPKTLRTKILESLPHQFSLMYLKNNKIFLTFLFFIVAINIILFVTRAFYFRNFSMLNGFKPNPFYLLSRANGRVIHFNSMLLLIFVLRYTITKMRELGMTEIFPLDNNIYFHKLVGVLVFVQSWIHTIMHLCNFGVNIQPDPVKFIQLTSEYWEYVGPKRPGWMNIPYHPPQGCELSNNTELCGDKLDLFNNVSWCQICTEESQPWSLVDWIFTANPNVFGLIGGLACPTGIALIIILTVMVICSMPFVRRGGYFEVFYFTHLLNMLYWILLILHAPDFWKWIIAPGVVFILEKTYRNLSSWMGKGKTVIYSGVVLPSKVTNLIIKRPYNFNFSPGDWVFVKIPAIAKSEWHPFTISSAPEQQGSFTLHIRGVGQWTNRLYTYFEEEYRRQQEGKVEIESGFELLRGTVRQKYKTMKNAIGIHKNKALDRELSSQDFQTISSIHQYDPERSKQRMKIREEKLKQRDTLMHNEKEILASSKNKSFRYMRRQPTIVEYDTEDLNALHHDNNNEESHQTYNTNDIEYGQKDPGKKMTLRKPLEIIIDGPFGAPSSNIFRAEHAVLIGTGIGVTPFASILQSIMHRYWQVKRQCPKCSYKWSDDLSTSMFNLKKVDFFWINRDQKSFEWFVKLLSQLEIEQSEQGGVMGHFLEMHMYITSALQRTDMKAVGLQLALDLLHEKEKRDLVTGLKSRTNAGRPNWNKVFTQIREQRKGRVTVFYCGNPILSKILRKKCAEFGFRYRKEVF